MQGKEHVPTEETRRMVQNLAFGKTTQPVIAAALGISDRSLREHYAHELEAKKSEIKSSLMHTGLMAGTGGGDWRKADLGMTKFMIDRFCDVPQQEQVHRHVHETGFEHLTDEQLVTLEGVLEQIPLLGRSEGDVDGGETPQE